MLAAWPECTPTSTVARLRKSTGQAHRPPDRLPLPRLHGYAGVAADGCRIPVAGHLQSVAAKACVAAKHPKRSTDEPNLSCEARSTCAPQTARAHTGSNSAVRTGPGTEGAHRGDRWRRRRGVASERVRLAARRRNTNASPRADEHFSARGDQGLFPAASGIVGAGQARQSLADRRTVASRPRTGVVLAANRPVWLLDYCLAGQCCCAAGTAAESKHQDKPKRPVAATKWRFWRDALRSRPLALGARPRRNVALQVSGPPENLKTCAQNEHKLRRNGLIRHVKRL